MSSIVFCFRSSTINIKNKYTSVIDIKYSDDYSNADDDNDNNNYYNNYCDNNISNNNFKNSFI